MPVRSRCIQPPGCGCSAWHGQQALHIEAAAFDGQAVITLAHGDAGETQLFAAPDELEPPLTSREHLRIKLMEVLLRRMDAVRMAAIRGLDDITESARSLRESQLAIESGDTSRIEAATAARIDLLEADVVVQNQVTEPLTTGAHHRLGRCVGRAVPVQQPAQLDAQVRDHAGHVRGADLGVRELGDHRVLKAHDEAQQHHGQRHEQPRPLRRDARGGGDGGFGGGKDGVLLGGGIGFAAMPTLILDNVPAHEAGSGVGVNALMRSVGTTIAGAVMAGVDISTAKVVRGALAGVLGASTPEAVAKADEKIDDAKVSAEKAMVDAKKAGADAVKVKGTITWVGVHDAVPAEARLYERLFTEEQPDAGDADFRTRLNATSDRRVQAFVEPSLAGAPADSRFQFERHGYFVTDRKDHTAAAPVFNRITGLKDGWK